MTRQRILVSAYGCEPGKGSEQGVGWNWVLQLSEIADLVVVTRSNNRASIEARLPDQALSNVHFVYYDLPERLRAFKRQEKGFYLYYILWQWGAYRQMRDLLMKQPADYAMHLTFGSVWLPTFMHRLPIPFIWGPVGGGEAVPWALIKCLPLKNRVLQYIRHLLIATVPINPLLGGVIRKSRAILARTGDTACIFPARHAAKVRVVLETAASDMWLQRRPRHHSGSASPVQIVYTGRLVALKNLDMAISASALARSRGTDFRFLVVGDGPMLPSLQSRVEMVGLADSFRFVGRCTQNQVFAHLEASDIYFFPSLKEGGVWSLMEAMAVGLPSICVDISGMKVITDDTCACLIQPQQPSKMIEAFADAICDLARAPDKRRVMGANARLRLEQNFRWNQKGQFMASLLKELGEGIL